MITLVYRKQTYVTNYTHLSVYCYTLKGKMLWQFQDGAVLVEPVGITKDNNSNVYVASNTYRCVIVLKKLNKFFFPMMVCIILEHNILMIKVKACSSPMYVCQYIAIWFHNTCVPVKWLCEWIHITQFFINLHSYKTFVESWAWITLSRVLMRSFSNCK